MIHTWGQIFTHETTADAKLINYIANQTVDFMEAGIKNGTMSTEAYWTLMDVSAAIPALKEKMDHAYAGKQAREKREAAKAAEWEARRESRNRKRAIRENAEYKKVQCWEDFQEASAGRCTISTKHASELMTGAIVFKGELAKEI